ncbi:MAG TPA: hypothetical protein PKV98_04480 [Burkholderiaceae bacterium]|nr:hypothetical protein [Burkholderiaceae bacterium]
MTDMLQDYLVIDGSEVAEDEYGYYAALQRQINNGSIWRMQGSAGRAAMDAIEGGYCMCARAKACYDFYGNRVPARGDLVPGSKGTWDFVAAHMGPEWAKQMGDVQ